MTFFVTLDSVCSSDKEHYTLECLLYFLKNIKRSHPDYVKQARGEVSFALNSFMTILRPFYDRVPGADRASTGQEGSDRVPGGQHREEGPQVPRPLCAPPDAHQLQEDRHPG